ncbi:MAG: tRNA (adenosine(37)-N6)-dimethylallyltransferase MiaA [Bacteroidetes bacterium]|nr:tRNA (adenosine(37)-N6)-dimethylallyltransferase MiaA [Bacteroidota bacterium]
MNTNKLLTITGPTATGKTRLAALVANKLQGEIISADSRQVYKGMNIGTGKDYEDYIVNGINTPFHLVDIADAGSEYNVYSFQNDFLIAYQQIIQRGNTPILCGGTGMYIESVLAGYKLINTPINEEFRLSLKDKTNEELEIQLSQLKSLHNITDTSNRERLIRAMEIINHETTSFEMLDFPKITNTLIGIWFEREFIRQRITQRLMLRLKSGMIEEIEQLIRNGLTTEQLKFYGLEYRYITMYINNEIGYDEMFGLLNTAIHQFAKRQMTWFRRMEKNGFKIHWIDGQKNETEKVEEIVKLYFEA